MYRLNKVLVCLQWMELQDHTKVGTLCMHYRPIGWWGLCPGGWMNCLHPSKDPGHDVCMW